MSEPLKIVLTAAATLLGGLFLLVLKQMFIEPVYDLRKLIGEIGHHVFLSRVLIENVVSPLEEPDRSKELELATGNLKELSAQLRAAVNVVPLFRVLSFCRLVPSKRRLLDAAGSLSVLSYCKYEDHKVKVSSEVDKLFDTLGLTMYGKQQ